MKKLFVVVLVPVLLFNIFRYSAIISNYQFPMNVITRNNAGTRTSYLLKTLNELQQLTNGDDDLDCPLPLLQFKNRIIWNDNNATFTNNTNRRFIPNILHISMQSRCLPRDLMEYTNRFEKFMPNYSIFFHDDDAVKSLIESEVHEFPDLERAMHCVKFKGAMTIDIWRILALYKYGGVYSDIDNWVGDDFKEDIIPSNVSGFFFSDVWSRPSQWFLAFEPRHPMMHLAMKNIIKNIFSIENIMKPKVVFVTGPQPVFHAYEKFMNGTEQRFELVKPGFHKGMSDKIILKMYHKGEGRNNILMNMGIHNYDDMVRYKNNNVTRRKRIELESGVMHFTTQRTVMSNKQKPISCEQYLKEADLP